MCIILASPIHILDYAVQIKIKLINSHESSKKIKIKLTIIVQYISYLVQENYMCIYIYNALFSSHN